MTLSRTVLFALCSLKVHIQTIGILVSEKSELQTALQYTQQAARQKAGVFRNEHDKLLVLQQLLNIAYHSLCLCLCVADAEELNNRLQATKQRVSELERTLSSVSAQQKQFEKVKDTAVNSHHKN